MNFFVAYSSCWNHKWWFPSWKIGANPRNSSTCCK